MQKSQQLDPKHTHSTIMREAFIDAAIDVAVTDSDIHVKALAKRVLDKAMKGVGVKRDRFKRKRKPKLRKA